jgi:hypothetical protein
VAFTAADFAAAQVAPLATVIDPHQVWMTSLPCDPEARWINSDLFPGMCLGDPRSILYACPFTLTEANVTAATVQVCWGVDDWLGDIGGPNPIGVYVNGVPLDSTFTAGSSQVETIATTTDCVVPVQTGTNWLYVYQRDAGCAVSGLILRATITTCSPTPALETTWGSLKAIY